MGWQCAVQMLQLVRGDGMRRGGKGPSKHKANAAAVVNEAFLIADPEDGHPIPYRKSASETYDRTRTKYNKYEGITTADGVMDALEDEMARHKIEVHTVDKKTGEPVVRYKAIQSNTPLGVAVIFNPPGAVTRNWTPEQHEKFITDCEDCLAQIPVMKLDKKGQIKKDKDGNPVDKPHYIFRKENRIARAEHWDESEPGDPPVYSPNWHEVYTGTDQDGKYFSSMVDSLFFSAVLNKMFPKLMRERGWDIDDTKHTDWEQFHADKKYRAETKDRIKKGGRSVNRYRADKKLEEAEAALEEASAMVEQAITLKQDMKERAEADADALREQAETDVDTIRVEAAAEAGEAVARAETEAELDAAAALDATRLEAEIEAAALLSGAQAKADTIRKTAQADAETAEHEKMQAEADRDAARKDAEDARERQMLAQLALAPLADTKARMQDEIQSLGQSLTKVRGDVEAAKTQAQEEIKEYRQSLMDQAKEDAKAAAKAEQARIEAAARAAWDTWLEDKKRKSSEKYDQIIQDAEDALAAASGEHAFLIRWLSHEPFIIKEGPQAGKTWLEVGRLKLQQEIRERRLAEHSQAAKDAAAQSQQSVGDGKGLGE